MTRKRLISICSNFARRGSFAVMFLLLFVTNLAGQEPPPRPLEITVTGAGLSFGAFTLGAAGGSVTVNASGARTSAGDVILLGLGYPVSAATFDLVANAGTLINLLDPADALLSNGVYTMTLQLGAASPGTTFVINTDPPAATVFSIGGSLLVGNIATNPPGSYTGTFNITFIYE